MQVNWKSVIQFDTPWDSGRPSEELQRFVGEGSVKPCRVLELGCGTGTNAIFLAHLSFPGYSCGLVETALDRAKVKAEEARVSIDFKQADVTDLPHSCVTISRLFLIEELIMLCGR